MLVELTGAGIEESIPWRWRAVSCDSSPAVMGRVVSSPATRI